MNGTTNALATTRDSAQLNRLTSTTRYRSTWTRLLLSCLGWAAPLAIANPGDAAEKIYVSYSLLERSLLVSSLEAYAKDGVPNEDLATYAQYANPTVLQNLRTALVAKADVSPITVAQFLYSPQGEAALKRLAQVVKTNSDIDPRKAGFKAIRAALILAAQDPEGLTLLNFLRKYPAKGIRIDVEQSLKIFNELQRLINQTNRATNAIIEQATAEIISEPGSQLPFDLRRRGSFTWEKQTLTLNDPSRRTAANAAPPTPQPPSAESLLKGRVYPVDIYLPNVGTARSRKPIPCGRDFPRTR
ncbi:MAG: alpha/beta hydrolase, partial [Leptolyngbyaceae cyanobacterium RU_5_1]|nr:alpha/beta hydrolase [Leptolyngbyaceae cyanobacterium RU_5_1]